MLNKKILSVFKYNNRNYSSFVNNLKTSINNRKNLNIEPEILKYDEVENLITELKNPNDFEEVFLLHQFNNRILPGVDNTSKLKANFLIDIVEDRTYCPLIDKVEAIDILGTMQGGYSIEALIKLLSSDYAEYSVKNLKNILLFDNFYNVEKLYKNGNPYAKKLLESWANAEWFTDREKVRK